VAYWTALYRTYANWALTTLAVVFGTGAMSPIPYMFDGRQVIAVASGPNILAFALRR
jgi:hypothetical protein